MIKLKVNDVETEFKTSLFPDGTSQVWDIKYQDTLPDYFKIDFYWENKEVEIFQLFMLIDLIRAEHPYAYIHLYMPFLVYGRQDKEISNSTTFALTSFAKLLNTKKLNLVSSFDAHSPEAKELIRNFYSISPENFHFNVCMKFKPDFIFYPDKGACERCYFMRTNYVFGEKVRNQLTGDIEGYKIVSSFPLKDKKILIVDDLVDGGATFVNAANELKKLGAGKLGLCVSHGLFSKGFDEMKAAGIEEFFTTNSLIKNKEGYNVL